MGPILPGQEPAPKPLNGRDAKGRFARGNEFASAGGKARAAALPPDRRVEIAKCGWWALVYGRFGGDVAAAKRFIGELGMWATEEAAYKDDPHCYKPITFRRPVLPARCHPDEIITAETYEEQCEAESRGWPWAPF